MQDSLLSATQVCTVQNHFEAQIEKIRHSGVKTTAVQCKHEWGTDGVGRGAAKQKGWRMKDDGTGALREATYAGIAAE